nr:Nif3-like dinuclear metal center hexameric protein [Bacteroidia bacterium]
MIRIKEVINVLENWASPAYQESYDNCGLLTGNSADEVKGIMVCLDSTEDVLDEAIKENCNLIIAHHPIVFSGLKKITGRNYVERVIIKAIKNNLALYALHTNLDNIETGVNMRLCHQLGLTNAKILLTKQGTLKKLVTFTPIAQAEKVRTALFEAGAGNISNYSECSFNVEGKGTFKPEAEANPVIGEKLIRHTESEVRTEVIFEAHKEYQVLKALFESHPYEEVAYDIYALTNSHQQTGSGMIALLEDEMDEIAFLN